VSISVGLIALSDPFRIEVPQAIVKCKTAGIKVVMITGDHHSTAEAISRKIGLITEATTSDSSDGVGLSTREDIMNESLKASVVSGPLINTLTDEQWAALIKKDQVAFARTTPEHKLIIVRRFAAAGHVVAMTGDGVNDAPALK
jgi:sodium/potassium-transporting ATPase subunit alpha